MEEYKQPQNNDPLINETESGDPRFLLKLRSRKVGIAPDRNCIVVDISDGIIINVRNIAMAVDTMVKVISGTRILKIKKNKMSNHQLNRAAIEIEKIHRNDFTYM